MGGHVSKKHPGMSKAFKKKQDTRDLRAHHRLYLNKAKELFKKQTGANPKQHRMKITELKKKLMLEQGLDPSCKPLLC